MKYLSARPFFAGVSPATPRVPKKKSAGSSEVKESLLENKRGTRERESLARTPANVAFRFIDSA